MTVRSGGYVDATENSMKIRKECQIQIVTKWKFFAGLFL